MEATRVLFRRQLAVRTPVPLVSFTFDDFPRSAFLEAGSILRRYGALGTYYVSLSLMGKQSPMGPMFEAEDLKELARSGSRARVPHFRALPFLEYASRHLRDRQSSITSRRSLNCCPGRRFKPSPTPTARPGCR